MYPLELRIDEWSASDRPRICVVTGQTHDLTAAAGFYAKPHLVRTPAVSLYISRGVLWRLRLTRAATLLAFALVCVGVASTVGLAASGSVLLAALLGASSALVALTATWLNLSPRPLFVAQADDRLTLALPSRAARDALRAHAQRTRQARRFSGEGSPGSVARSA
ncbi:MAG: hypothetical protein H6739_36940 [Alphaproteobacteria bacterium]|nr:hypothetical protein [Alphaproteobacteria bacterium]